MKKYLMCLACLCVMGVSTQAFVIEDFSGDLSAWTSTVILDAGGTGSNTAAWQISGGVLQLNTSFYDGIEQYAMIKSGVGLPVGTEVQMDLVHNLASQDLGLYVGGTAPQTGVRQDYIAMYARNTGEVFSRGFDGTSEYGQVGWVSPAYEKLFIARTDTNTFEVGYYEGGVRTVLITRTPTTPNAATYVGFYADVRAAGVLGDLDNLEIVSKPYGPSVDQEQDLVNGVVDVTFSWNAGVDPAGVNVVDPDFADQYVFLSGEDLVADPNLYYVGSTGDPLNDPASSLVVQDLLYDSTYSWVVVEALTGHTQTLTASSTLNDVDPNNIVGPTWSFDTLTSVPTITLQPVAARVFATDPNAVFTCEFTSNSAATVLWYKTGTPTPLSTGGDIIVSTTDDGKGNYMTALEILTPAVTYEGNYYCTIDNGTPLVTSDAPALVVKRLLAQYDFDGDLADSSGNGAPIGQGKSIDGLAEPNSLLASNVTLVSAEGVDGVAGHAVQVDPNQYVDFGTAGYPKASSTTSNGVGAGLDAGTILCWVKPVTAPAGVLANFNDGPSTGFLLSLAPNAGTADTRIIIRGDSTVYTEIGTVQGRPDRPDWDMFDGAWHLIAASWSAGGTMRIYVDGQQTASVGTGIPEGYLPWEQGVLLGASRQGTRHLLSDLYGGLVDNLRVYNYEIDADAIAQEYLTNTGIHPCVDGGFVGSYYNTDNTGSSYCQVDLADFADFAATWLANGLY